ncbi:DNA-binding transcription factor [Lithospermum erythrorhizon]|uniref:DNA-binding transcription factor n=1 Tax=Lithospermum erythrorhizon TaxID=34254 RepID=A0AAV3RFC1_LITER
MKVLHVRLCMTNGNAEDTEGVNHAELGEPKSGVEDPSIVKTGSEIQCENVGEAKEGSPAYESKLVDQEAMENMERANNPNEKQQVCGAGAGPEGNNKNRDPVSDDACLAQNKRTIDEAERSSERTVALAADMSNGSTKMVEIPETEKESGHTDQKPTSPVVDVVNNNVNKTTPVVAAVDGNGNLAATPLTKMCDVNNKLLENDDDSATPQALLICQSPMSGSQSRETGMNVFNEIKMPGDEDGTPEEQVAFMRELEHFYRKRATEFKAPRFYGQQLNCLKLWRSVIRLGGYDRVTGSKLWRHVGESFHPPKTCTTVSWTFRIFYEKALLEFERHKKGSGELQLPLFALSDPSGDNEGSSYPSSGSGRVQRDSAGRAMQGWQTRLHGNGESGDQVMKDRNGNNLATSEKNLNGIGSLKQKRANEVEHPVKAARTEAYKQLVTSVVDVGPPADWVKINVRETKDGFEVYALVPGLLHEEVHVQSDPAGRLVITGQPYQPDNPWGITPFKKVVSLPSRIDPLQTSAVVSLHGRLFVRVPFET